MTTNNQINTEAASSQSSEVPASADKLSEQLELWYQQSQQQHPMPAQHKRELQQRLQAKTQPRFSGVIGLLRRLQQGCSWPRLQALTAVFALGLGWFLIQQQQQLTYQISQTNTLYPVQLHQLNNENLNTGQSSNAQQQRQQIFSQRYQDYQKSVAAGHVIKQQVLARQSAKSGWQLDLCQKMQLQLSEGWLSQFKQQQQWSEPQWALLANSRYLEVSTGVNGEIIAINAAEQPPSCAP